jgi:hypothetical protein
MQPNHTEKRQLNRSIDTLRKPSKDELKRAAAILYSGGIISEQNFERLWFEAEHAG